MVLSDLSLIVDLEIHGVFCRLNFCPRFKPGQGLNTSSGDLLGGASWHS